MYEFIIEVYSRIGTSARNDWNLKPERLERTPGLIGKSGPDYPPESFA